MFGLAECANSMPCQADALNDLSLMPPVSVTMQARNVLPEAPAVLVAAADVAAELGLDALAAGALDELLPHAASSRLVAAAAAVAIKAVCLTVSSTGLRLPEPRRHGAAPLAQTARNVKPFHTRCEEARRHCG